MPHSRMIRLLSNTAAAPLMVDKSGLWDLRMDKRWWSLVIFGGVTAVLTMAVNAHVYRSLATPEDMTFYTLVGVGLPLFTLVSYLVTTLFQRHADVRAAEETHVEIRRTGDGVVDRVVAAIDSKCCSRDGARKDGGDDCKKSDSDAAETAPP